MSQAAVCRHEMGYFSTMRRGDKTGVGKKWEDGMAKQDRRMEQRTTIAGVWDARYPTSYAGRYTTHRPGERASPERSGVADGRGWRKSRGHERPLDRGEFDESPAIEAALSLADEPQGGPPRAISCSWVSALSATGSREGRGCRQESGSGPCKRKSPFHCAGGCQVGGGTRQVCYVDIPVLSDRIRRLEKM